MAKISKVSKKPSVESITTTIEIAKKLEKEELFFVHPHPTGTIVGVKEKEPFKIGDKEQNSETFSSNLGIIHHVAFHILLGTEDEIRGQISDEIVEVIRNKYIDEVFREKFYVGSTSTSYLFIETDYTIATKLATSELTIEPSVPYITLWFDLIKSSNGERKKIPIEMDNRTFFLLFKQLNEINDKLKSFYLKQQEIRNVTK